MWVTLLLLLFHKRTNNLFGKVLISSESKQSTTLEDGVTLAILLPFEKFRCTTFLLSHTAVLLVLLILTSNHF